MKIKRQRFIPYILVLLVAFVIPQIASADDPCKDFNDTVTKFVSEIPRLSSSELTVGRFDVENNKISYMVNGNKIFKKEWHDSCDPSDEFCKAQITPILGLGGYGGLHIAQQGRHFALTCDHLIFPSSTTNSFKSVSKPWSITVKDLDNDNVSEVISHELQQWALDCDLCLACIDATAWNDIYHLTSEGKLIPVNEQFPQRYAELLTQYRKQYDRFKQDTKNYVNACNSQQLSNQFQALINRAEKIAGSGATADGVHTPRIKPYQQQISKENPRLLPKLHVGDYFVYDYFRYQDNATGYIKERVMREEKNENATMWVISSTGEFVKENVIYTRWINQNSGLMVRGEFEKKYSVPQNWSINNKSVNAVWNKKIISYDIQNKTMLGRTWVTDVTGHTYEETSNASNPKFEIYKVMHALEIGDWYPWKTQDYNHQVIEIVKISVPTGTFKCWKIKDEISEHQYYYEYYDVNTGILVRWDNLANTNGKWKMIETMVLKRFQFSGDQPPVSEPNPSPDPITDAKLSEKGVNITTRPSITIITHGYASSGDRNNWPNALASAISARDTGNKSAAEGGDIPIYLLTVDREHKVNLFNDNVIEIKPTEQLPKDFSQNVVHNGDGKSKSSAIVIVNWSGADEGIDEVGATLPTDRIAQLIVDYIMRSSDAMTLPIHLIGHSRGGSVMLSLATILAHRGLWVEQLTTLDPHPLPYDFEGGKGARVDDPIVKPNLLRNVNYQSDKLRIPNNVIFADNYRQWINSPKGYPQGHILDGALDENLTNVITPSLPPGPHSDVHNWYHFTTDLNADSFVIGGTTSSLGTAWYDANSRTTKGFNISRHKMGVSTWRTLCNNSLNTSCGLHEEISGKSTPRFSVEVERSIARPSILINEVLNPDLRLAGLPVIRIGDQLQISVYYSAPVNPADIVINLDDDMNPFNDTQIPVSGTCQSFSSLLALSVKPTLKASQTIQKATLQVTIDNSSFTADKLCFIRATIKDKLFKRIDYVQRAITIMSRPQGKINTIENKIIPAAKSKIKKDASIRCNKGSLVSSPSTGSAEGAINRYGTGTDGCTK